MIFGEICHGIGDDPVLKPGHPGVDLKGNPVAEPKGPGRFSWCDLRVPARRREWLSGLTDVLIRGIEDLREENPKAIHLEIERDE